MNWWSDKYKTGSLRDVTVRIANLPGDATFTTRAEVCETGIGDLVDEYISRIRMPWWKRIWHIGWRSEVSSIRSKLNAITVSWAE